MCVSLGTFPIIIGNRFGGGGVFNNSTLEHFQGRDLSLSQLPDFQGRLAAIGNDSRFAALFDIPQYLQGMGFKFGF